jgi:hypothetical protein
MTSRMLWITCVLALSSAFALAAEMTATVFAAPPAASGELGVPRSVAMDAGAARCYVLDSGLARVMACSLDGEQLASWPLSALGVELPLSGDPLLPEPTLAVGGGTAYLLQVNHDALQVNCHALTGSGKSRTLAIPNAAADGGVTVDNLGRVLLAYLRPTADSLQLILAREGADGRLTPLDTLNDPCGGETSDVRLTGFTIAPDGRFAIGLAQAGNDAYGFVRSWLAQGTLKDGVLTPLMRVTHHFTLLDAQGTVLERYRAALALAGKAGYPDKACVPLFTALAFGPGGSIISGGQSADPFLRVYGKDGALLHSQPREATGGETLATLPTKTGMRLFTTNAADQRIDELDAGGQTIAGFGHGAAYDLMHPVALAADPGSLYVVSSVDNEYALLRFTAEGRFCWVRSLDPPAGMEQAQPFLAVTHGDRVLVGWRLPKAAGIGDVETVMEDGLPGLPLWSTPMTTLSKPTAAPCPTPLITGQDGRVYVLRDTKDGPLLYAFSSTGTYLQYYPPAIQGITIATAAGALAWAHPDDTGMIISSYTRLGEEQGWKRIPRPAQGARFLPAQASDLWGWLTSTNTLLKLDDKLMVIDEANVQDGDGHAVNAAVTAVTGDGHRRIYLAEPGRILMVQAEE